MNKHAWQQAINTAQMMTEEDTGGGGQKYNPHVVRGFKGLADRVKSQEFTIEAQEAQLKALSEKVEMIRSEQHTLDMEIKEITDENARLTQDILANLRAPSQVNHHKVGSCRAAVLHRVSDCQTLGIGACLGLYVC